MAVEFIILRGGGERDGQTFTVHKGIPTVERLTASLGEHVHSTYERTDEFESVTVTARVRGARGDYFDVEKIVKARVYEFTRSQAL